MTISLNNRLKVSKGRLIHVINIHNSTTLSCQGNMTLQIVVVSRETIKPSFPTPQHLKDFKLSQADQLCFPIHVPVILFYQPKRAENKFDYSKAFHRLKTSLSETLTRFYPLGGRIFDNQTTLQCNDNGVEYLETLVGGDVIEVVRFPKQGDLNQLLPCDLSVPMMGSDPLLAIQVNKFECGGIAITICVSHKIADASSLCTFVNSWAQTAYGTSEKILSPKFDAATIFPPRQGESLVLPGGSPINKVVSRKFVFDSSNISSLKAKAANGSYVTNPTSVEAIVALIWRCALQASRDGVGFVKPSVMNFGVNIRGKMTPPLLDHSFGNLVMGAITPLTTGNEMELHCLAGKLREAKRELYEDYLKALPITDVLAITSLATREAILGLAKGELEFYNFTSWCKFPFYEADFGWGKPIWASFVNFSYKNTFILMDTESGDGVEAWVNLDENEMARFECEEELLSYTSPAP